MRIAHISDIHIRNFRYKDEYRTAFADLYRQLGELAPDLVINTGDTVHSKLSVSPELFDDVAGHMLAVTEIAPYWIILGNHDLNLKNATRTDAISPIVRALGGRTRFGLRLLGPGEHTHPQFYHRYRFWCYDIRGHGDFAVNPYYVNIGLHHGSVSGCATDSGFIMKEGESEIGRFAGMDYVMLGDIHKRQSFRDGRIWYPGSLIQQNYGEERTKGFLLWNIISKDEWSVDFHPVSTTGRFYTIQVPASLDLGGVAVPSGSRIKAIVEGGVSPSQRMRLEEALRIGFDPIEIITPDVTDEGVGSIDPIDIDSLVGPREQLMRDHLRDVGVRGTDVDAVLELYTKYSRNVECDVGARGTTWQLRRMVWDNMMNYGEGNTIDFTKLSGIVGIFAPNASGKSSIFDILLEALFDKVSKDVPRNIDLVNDNRDVGRMVVDIESQGRPYTIERTIERIHYGQRRFAETKQWGETSLDFSSVDDALNGTTRPETERAIRSVIGSFEDFVLTAMVSQGPIFGLPGGADILNCRETDRRKILFRFLDLDVYEQVGALVRDDLKQVLGQLRGDRESLLAAVATERASLAEVNSVLDARRSESALIRSRLETLRGEISGMHSVDATRIALSEARRRFDELLVAESAASARVDAAQRQLEDRVRRRQEMKSSMPPDPGVPEGEIITDLRKVTEQVSALSRQLTKTQGVRTAGIKSLKILDEVPCGDSFPTCRFLVEANRFRDGLATIDATLASLTDSLAGHEARKRDLEASKEKCDELKVWETRLTSTLEMECLESEKLLELSRAHEAITRDRTATGEEVQRLTSCLDVIASEELDRLTREVAQLESTLTTLGQSIDESLVRTGSIGSRLDAAETALRQYDEVKGSVRILEHLSEMCGKNGLPYRILSLALPVINAEIAKILTGIVKFNVSFEADPERQTVGLSIRYGDYRSRPLSLGSGAERFISSLAVRVALLSISSLPKTDILIVDEGFGRLDPEHLESVQRMFEYLRGAFSSVFIVSHVDSMRDMVDHSVEITNNGYAHVEVS